MRLSLRSLALFLLGLCACEPDPIAVKLHVLHAEDCERSKALEEALVDWAPTQELVYLGCVVGDHPPTQNVLDRDRYRQQFREDYLPVLVYDELELAHAFWDMDNGTCNGAIGIGRDYLDERRILSHELGHMFGLPHTDDPRSVMRDEDPGPTAFNEYAVPLDCPKGTR